MEGKIIESDTVLDLINCSKDFSCFCEKCSLITTRKTQFSKLILNFFQEIFFEHFENEDFVVITKQRQVGFSTFVVAYALWKALFEGDQKIRILSPNNKMGNIHFEKCLYYLENLPDYIKWNYSIDTNNKSIKFQNDSLLQICSIFSCPSRESDYLFLDEAYFMNGLNLKLRNLFIRSKRIYISSSVDDENNDNWFTKLIHQCQKNRGKFSFYRT